LEGLHENPDKAYYMEHQTEIDDYIRQPFKALFRDVAEQLPEEITDVMETDKRLFSRILKNDFGRGGAWDHYWGAFYPQGTKRTESAQLMLWVNWHRVEFGFYIGEYGNEPRQRFLHNWGENESFLRDYLQDVLPRAGVRFGSRPEGMTLVPQDQTDLEKWSNQLDETDIQIAIPQSKQQILTWSKDELSTQIVRTFEALFPLVLLATFDDPMPAIGRYLEPDGEDEELQPPYPMAQMMQDTHLDADTLTRWVRAINRKGQAVLYGPPGTGKTYVAERLARHLIGDGDGFSELVQFHPAYAYEDFIQGIRPRTRGDGELTYKMVPGRFLDFCDKARRRQDTCVLIVDEINRANLSRVFGELMYLLEYRGKDKAIPLAGGKAFSIPDNVRLIGTMNTADRSIALVDHALRRRFAFLPLWPKYEVLHRYHRGRATHVNLAGLIDTLRDVNNQIGDRNYHLGITFFLVPDLDRHIADIWRVEIVPYLEEYFFDNPGQVDAFRWQQVRDQIQS
jgi:5-methylcytosine-specific restriction protein B